MGVLIFLLTLFVLGTMTLITAFIIASCIFEIVFGGNSK